MRSDNELALLAVIREALRGLCIDEIDSAAAEGSVPHDPQTNGAAETGVRRLKGQFRALQLCLEESVGMVILPRHPVMSWLVRHAAHVRSLRRRGSDGRTPYERLRGTENKATLAGIGEVVRYKARAQEPNGIAGSGWRWSTAVWLGLDHRTNQYILFDQSYGIRMDRTMM